MPFLSNTFWPTTCITALGFLFVSVNINGLRLSLESKEDIVLLFVWFEFKELPVIILNLLVFIKPAPPTIKPLGLAIITSAFLPATSI